VQPDSEDPTRIEIRLDVKLGTPLNVNSVAKLGSVTVVTSPVISISTGSKEARRLQAGEVIPSQETVSLDDMERKIDTLADSAQTLLESAKKDLNDFTGDARALIANLKNITGDPNQRHIAEILANADAVIARVSPKIDQLADQATKLMGDADAAVAKVGPLMENANTTVSSANEAISNIRDPLKTDLATLNETLLEARGLMRDLRSTVRAKDKDLEYTIDNVRTITDNLNDLTESLKQRPWSLIRIRQPEDRRVPSTGGHR
jgi:ABC-type transporter Mla subunit MlaD